MRARPLALVVVLLGACGLQEHRRAVRPADASPGDTNGNVSPDPSAPDAVPAPGVTIGGVFVPREKAIVFVHIGHSNMAGRATTPAALRPHFHDTDPRVWTYAGAFALAREPTAPDDKPGQAAGPGMALLRSAQQVAAPDAFLISVGHGHSGSFGGICASFRKGGLLYDVAMTPAKELRGKVTFAAILTMFGQSEHRTTREEMEGFADCLQGIAAEMRADLGDPAIPFLVGDYERGISRPDIAPSSAFAMRMIAQIAMVPGKVTRAAVIPTDGFPMQDDHHFDLAGHKLWAEAGVRLLVDRGWAPWATKD